MTTYSNIVKQRISKMEKGTVFFPSDLSDTGVRPSVIQKTLERAAVADVIVRLGQGIYYVPKMDDKYGLGMLYPSYEVVAQRIAERDSCHIIPTGAYAANLLGLSTQVPMNLLYLTDGTSKSIKLKNGKVIKFKHTSPKRMSYKNRTLMMLVLALEDIGKDNITEEQTNRVKTLLYNIPLEQVKEDLHLMPAWIKDYILNFYEKIL